MGSVIVKTLADTGCRPKLGKFYAEWSGGEEVLRGSVPGEGTFSASARVVAVEVGCLSFVRLGICLHGLVRNYWNLRVNTSDFH